MQKPKLNEALLFELDYEFGNTLKLLNAIPNDLLNYQPNSFNWTIAQHASHIAELYSWWIPTLQLEVLELTEFQYQAGDISNIASIIETCTKNYFAARELLIDYPEEKLFEIWRLTQNGKDQFPPAKRIGVIRSFLMSHLYHHRGELVALLRVNHLPVPGLFGPSYEEMQSTN